MAQTPVNERKKGFCEICGKEYANFSQHLNTSKHKRKAAEHENTKPINGNGIIYTEGEEPETRAGNNEAETMSGMPANEIMQENRTIAGIQIIDNNTGKKQPSGLDRILDIAFSPEIAPITLSIMDGIAKRLSGNLNNEVEEGNLVTTVSGAVIKVPNKEF